MLVITRIQLLLEIGDMISLVILLVWPPLHFIIFKVLLFIIIISLDCSRMRISDRQGDCCISFPFSQVQQLWYLGSKVYGFRRVYPVSSTPGVGLSPRASKEQYLFHDWNEILAGCCLFFCSVSVMSAIGSASSCVCGT